MGEVCYEAVKQEMLGAESKVIVKLLMESIGIVLYGRAREERRRRGARPGDVDQLFTLFGVDQFGQSLRPGCIIRRQGRCYYRTVVQQLAAG
jgi:hypothetical protein